MVSKSGQGRHGRVPPCPGNGFLSPHNNLSLIHILGQYSEQCLALLQSLGYRSVFWSFAYQDWDPDNQMEPSKALEKVTGDIHEGAIYLLHAVSKTNTEILGDVIDAVRAKGLTICSYDL